VVADDRDYIPSALCGESGRLLNRLRPIDLGSAVFAATSGGVDDRPGGSQFDREGTTRTASRTGDEGGSSDEGLVTIDVRRSFLGNNRIIVYIAYYMPTVRLAPVVLGPASRCLTAVCPAARCSSRAFSPGRTGWSSCAPQSGLDRRRPGIVSPGARCGIYPFPATFGAPGHGHYVESLRITEVLR
jgi:hypothetical protein